MHGSQLRAIENQDKRGAVELPRNLITTDAVAVAIDPEIDRVIEVMGAIEPTLTSIKAALGGKQETSAVL